MSRHFKSQLSPPAPTSHVLQIQRGISCLFNSLLLVDVSNLQHSLAKVLARQHAEEGVGSGVDAGVDVQLDLEGAVGDPLLQLLLVVDGVLGAHFRVADDEAAHGDALADDVEQVADAVALVRLQVVLRDHATGDCVWQLELATSFRKAVHDWGSGSDLSSSALVKLSSTLRFRKIAICWKNFSSSEVLGEARDIRVLTDPATVVHGLNGSREGLTANVLVVDVDALRSQAGESVGRLLLLVVEASIELELVGDEIELLVVTDAANDGQALELGQLADNLADGTAGGGDEDGLALLGLANLVKGAEGGQAGHAERANEVGGVEVMAVLDEADGLGLLGGEGAVLLDGDHADDDITGLELLGVALQDLGDDIVVDGLVELEGGEVGLDLGVPHAGTLVGVQRGIVVLERDAASRRSGVQVEATVLDGEVNTGLGDANGRVLEDEALVLDHFGR